MTDDPQQTPARSGAMTCSADRLIAEAITEAVCAQFMDYQGYGTDPAPFNLKADIYHRVITIFENGVEV